MTLSPAKQTLREYEEAGDLHEKAIEVQRSIAYSYCPELSSAFAVNRRRHHLRQAFHGW